MRPPLTQNLKVLALVVAQNQSHQLSRAVNSLVEASRHHHNWHLALVNAGRDGHVVAERLVRSLDVLSVYDVRMTDDQKTQTGGAVGYALNRAILDTDADVAFVLRDTDQVHERYLVNLDIVFSSQHGTDLFHSEVVPFDAMFDDAESALRRVGTRKEQQSGFFERLTGGNLAVLPDEVSLPQLAWRTQLNRSGNCWFQHNGFDWADRYVERLLECAGFSTRSGLIGQFVNTPGVGRQGQPTRSDDTQIRTLIETGMVQYVRGLYDLAANTIGRVLELRPNDQQANDIMANIKSRAGG